jgi:phenylalanine-4-hydroxylase
LVTAELAAKHERYAVREFLEAKAAVSLPEDRVPQVFEVTERLAPLTGWSLQAALHARRRHARAPRPFALVSAA